MPTEAKEIFEATSKSFRELMSENGLGLYIPAYQRPYGWDKAKVERLVEDVLHGLNRLRGSDDSFTFLGTIITIHDINHVTVHPIVKDQTPARVLTVIDGQQRLCSLVLLAVCVHNYTKLRFDRLFKKREQDDFTEAETWLHDQSLQILTAIGGTFYERHASGDSPIYPRIIRAFSDQWARKATLARYESPIAHLIAAYAKTAIDGAESSDFKLSARGEIREGEAALVKRFDELRATVRKLASGDDATESLEGMPSLPEMAGNKGFQRALLNHEFPEAVLEQMKKVPESNLDRNYADLLRLLILGSYVLNRIAVTVVRGKNEDYAFTIFESLNTTGEPLTAFETFKPRVVSAEGLAEYEISDSRPEIDQVADYLSNFPAGNSLQNATSDLLVAFALAETGYKLPKRLADQRIYLKEEYERYSTDPQDRVDFVTSLRRTADFVQYTWDSALKETPVFHALPIDATTDTMKLCLAFLRKLGHSVTIAPIVRFYSAALGSSASDKATRISELEGAVKAVTAFSVLWRSSRRTTGNIDQQYRYIMQGVECAHMAPLARCLRRDNNSGSKLPSVDLQGLKKELRARLVAPNLGGLSGRDSFVSRAAMLPIYDINITLTRFLLLAAYHDTVEDAASPGLIRAGKEDSNPCFTFDGWRNESHLSIEHVIPQSRTDDWPSELYEDREAVNRIGNLVLMQHELNSSAGNRSWHEKGLLYRALGAKSKDEAKAILMDANAEGIEFSQSTATLVESSRYSPHLLALGSRIEAWDKEFLEERSKRLLGLVWARLGPWLDLSTE